MTADPPTTDTSRPATDTIRGRLRRHRAVLIIVGVVVLAALALAWWADRPSSERLDPDGTGQEGSRALVQLLQDQGVQVERATTSDQALDDADADTTVVVTVPGRLSQDQLDAVLRSEATVVLVEPGRALQRLDVPVSYGGDTPSEVTEPGCSLPAAQRAGPARAGTSLYQASGDATSCYDGRVLRTDLGGPDSTVPLVVVGGEPLLNQHLDDDGNAALALGLLGQQSELVLYTPSLQPSSEDENLVALLPDWVVPVSLQLFVAAAFVALWRSRRLGPVVTEPLPVVVRSTETTEGRARLYRRGHAREHAAAVLRGSASDRLRIALGLPRGTDMTVLIGAVAEHSGRAPSEVAATLAGTPPDDDAALVRLADQLDALEREVHRT